MILDKSLKLYSYQFIYQKTKFPREQQALAFHDFMGLFGWVVSTPAPTCVFSEEVCGGPCIQWGLGLCTSLEGAHTLITALSIQPLGN